MLQPVKDLKTELLALGRADATVNTYCSIAAQFLGATKGKVDQKAALEYLAKLREKNAKASTRNTTYYALRKLFANQGIPFDVPAPKRGDPSEVSRPVLSNGEVVSLIECAKEQDDPKYAAYLVLSTIYGIRRFELRLLREHMLDDNHVMIWTRKGGRPTKHLIPEQVSPFLYNFKHWGALSDTAASTLFKEILILSGNGIKKGFGWHSVRRALLTGLRRAGVDTMNIYQFTRWSTARTAMAMLNLYTGSFDQEEIDTIVFENHPFLDAWGNNEPEETH